jgi:hypothetical protein
VKPWSAAQAKANGCPWNSYIWVYAARGGNLAVLQWLQVRSASSAAPRPCD